MKKKKKKLYVLAFMPSTRTNDDGGKELRVPEKKVDLSYIALSAVVFG